MGNPENYADPSGNNHVSFDPAAMTELIYRLTGNEKYQETADKMWENQAEQTHYEYSISRGVTNGVIESAYDAMASVVNIYREIINLYTLNKKRQISEADLEAFHTYLDNKALQASDKDFYYLGKCCGNGIAFGVDAYLTLYSYVKAGGPCLIPEGQCRILI